MQEGRPRSGRKPDGSTEKATHRTCFARDLQQHEEAGSSVFFYRGNYSLRRGAALIAIESTAGVVALGESLRLIAAEGPH